MQYGDCPRASFSESVRMLTLWSCVCFVTPFTNETATRGKKDNNNKTVQKCVKKFARTVKWEPLLQKRNWSRKYVETGASKRTLPWEVQEETRVV